MAVGMIRFDNGAMLTIEASFVAHIEKDIFNFQVFGEKGGAVWDTSQIFTDHGSYMMNMTPAMLGKWDDWEYKMRHFVEVCRDGAQERIVRRAWPDGAEDARWRVRERGEGQGSRDRVGMEKSCQLPVFSCQ